MWEHRLVWVAARPAWWNETWRKGLEVLARQQREPEARPDTYLVLLDRVDVGLKLRGGNADEFDVKMRHARDGGSSVEIVQRDGALCCGYPELLVRHVRGTL
jgi:hypothetical protein